MVDKELQLSAFGTGFAVKAHRAAQEVQLCFITDFAGADETAAVFKAEGIVRKRHVAVVDRAVFSGRCVSNDLVDLDTVLFIAAGNEAQRMLALLQLAGVKGQRCLLFGEGA